ncbi:MAG: hypothetical protein LAP85_10720 [Acidobacteriia bacterium]|nr:hypothetical protein [Terriglobia bacterium]
MQNMTTRHISGRSGYHRKIYLGLLIFVTIAGLPIVGVPSLRQRLRSRVETLRSAAAGEPVPQAPAKAVVGENHEPFPHEYERSQQVRPSYLPNIEVSPRPQVRFAVGGDQTTPPAIDFTPPAAKGKPASKAVPAPSEPAATGGQAAAGAGADSQYKKGKSEQEAYDILVNSNQTLAAMIKGTDPTLKFQDWSASNKGEESYYVSVTFVQTSDNIVRRYIWNVKVMTKEVVPLNFYAMGISK